MIKINPQYFDGPCYAFHNRDIIVHNDGSALSLSELHQLQESTNCSDIICEPEYHFCAMTLRNKEVALPKETKAVGLRFYNYEHDEDTTMRTFRAKGLASWFDTTRFCPYCGKRLRPSTTSFTSLTCEACHNEYFPRINPCIIVLVNRGDKVLLARHAQRNQDIYACIAGFMETGETAEQCVRREILEETGIKVKNIQYFGSQSWPFPSQLMLGFTAEYESGELTLQEEEISDAAWFSLKECPATPAPGSIAYQLIETAKSKIINKQ